MWSLCGVIEEEGGKNVVGLCVEESHCHQGIRRTLSN